MGRVRNKKVKKAARLIVEKYQPYLEPEFHLCKKVCDQVAVIPSKRVRNQVAG
jgi:ribosomal protein S17E